LGSHVDTELTEHARAPVELDLLGCVPGLKLILLRLTKNRDTAQELLQDVLLNCLSAIRAGRVHSIQSLPAYAREVARNAAFGYTRRDRVSSTSESLDSSYWADAVKSPLELCETCELQTLASSILENLSARDQALIRGFYIQGKSKIELLAQFDLNADHFDKVLSRARLRMRELMQKKLGPVETMMSELAPSAVFHQEQNR
jgi:RNA polymerase sigma factor (sigma-70 family)